MKLLVWRRRESAKKTGKYLTLKIRIMCPLVPARIFEKTCTFPGSFPPLLSTCSPPTHAATGWKSKPAPPGCVRWNRGWPDIYRNLWTSVKAKTYAFKLHRATLKWMQTLWEPPLWLLIFARNLMFWLCSRSLAPPSWVAPEVNRL